MICLNIACQAFENIFQQMETLFHAGSRQMKENDVVKQRLARISYQNLPAQKPVSNPASDYRTIRQGLAGQKRQTMVQAVARKKQFSELKSHWHLEQSGDGWQVFHSRIHQS